MNIKKIRFKCTETSKHPITFERMKFYSLENLEVIKLKFCTLKSELFLNLSMMNCAKNIRIINFKGCDFDPKDLCIFI